MATSSTMTLNGRIEKTNVPTLLRSVEKDKSSGELSFNRNGERVDLYFLFGQLYHAKWGEVTGIDAVVEVLNWKNGNYAFTEGIIPAQASINDDIERILSSQAVSSSDVSSNSATGVALPANPGVSSGWSSPAPVAPMPMSDASGDLSDLIPFDLASLDSMNAVYPGDPTTPSTNQPNSRQIAVNGDPGALNAADEALASGRVAPSPPANGLYRTKLFCLPTGEQMATSLVATGPQLEEELLHLSEVRFTGYVLGGPEIGGYPTVGICLFRGRFIHAFYHLSANNGTSLIEGERAYRTALDQRGSSAARFYWFYELTIETMRAAIALLTPPTRYSHLEVRILRFKEVLRLLNEESFTGTLRITIPSGATNIQQQPSPLAGERAYIPVYQGTILGLWSERSPRLTNDGQLLQRFLNEMQAYLDLHATAPVAEPGLPLESLIATNTQEPNFTYEPEPSSGSSRLHGTDPLVPPGAGSFENVNQLPEIALDAYASDAPMEHIDDDERQLYLITSIGRMESTWTNMQKKGKIDDQTLLLALSGFANEALSMLDSVAGRRGIQEMLQRAMKNELAPYRSIFQMLDIAHGRVNIGKLLRQYEMFNRENPKQADDFVREVGRGLRTLLRTTFQHFVSLIRAENTRFESHDMYEVFLQEVVKKM